MTSATTVQASVAFSADDNPRLLLTLHPSIAADSSIIRLRLYPDVPATIRASAGDIRVAERQTDAISYELLKFSGTNHAQLKYPGSTGHRFTNVNALFTADGDPITDDVSFSYDPDADEVLASQPFYGGVQVAYSVPYQVLEYTPRYEETGGVIDNGYLFRYGMVIAVYKKAVATFDVQAPDEKKNSDFVEMYRVYSKVIADPDGRWEMPPGWPTNTKYPYITSDGPDAENSHDEERVDVVGFIDKRGRTDYQTYYANMEKPYVGNVNYKPIRYLRKQTKPPSADYAVAFQSINWDAITAALIAKYGALQAA